MISILLHLYYPESVKTVLPKLTPEFLQGNRLYINLVNSVPFDESAFEKYENLTLIKSPNIGKDIGGKLVLIDSILHQNDDNEYWVFLHDKNSPHTTTGKFWRDSLFTIVDMKNKNTILNHFQNSDISVVTHKLFVRNEWLEKEKRFDTINNDIIKQLMEKYAIKPSSFEFAAGTMFWAKSKPLKEFFTKHNPLRIRETIEKGNVLDHHAGTHAHSWERLLSWIPMGAKNKIAGIE